MASKVTVQSHVSRRIWVGEIVRDRTCGEVYMSYVREIAAAGAFKLGVLEGSIPEKLAVPDKVSPQQM